MVILESARIRPSPFNVKEVKLGETLKLNGSYFLSNRPSKKVGALTVHDLRGL